MSVKRALSISSLLTTLFPLLVLGQESFERTYGGSYPELGYSVQQTTDKGFIVTGSTLSFGTGATDVYLIKTSPVGNMVWSRTYGGGQSEIGYSLDQTRDGGFIIAGFTYSYGAGNGDVYLVRTDSSGDTLWTRTFGSSEFDWGYSVDQTSDGGYIIAGSTASFGAEAGDIYVIRTDSLGIAVWARGYGDYQTDYARSVQQTADGGFIIAGTTYSFGTGTGDIYVIKTDASGTPTWTKTFGREGVDEGNCVIQTQDGGYIVAGEIYSPQAANRDAYLIRLDASGDSLWAKSYGGVNRDVGSSVRETADGGYVLAGYTESFGEGNRDVYLVRTDSEGDTLWTRTYGGYSWDAGKAVWVAIDGGYVIAGDTDSFGAGSRDIYLIKTDEVGYVGIDPDGRGAPTIPRSYVLRQNFPNPFNPSTTIAFEIPGDAGTGLSHARGSGSADKAGGEIPDATVGAATGGAGAGNASGAGGNEPGAASLAGATTESRVRLAVFDLRGRQVAVLVDSDLVPGAYRVTWDGRDDAGRSVPSGIYLYRLESDRGTLTRKMSIWR